MRSSARISVAVVVILAVVLASSALSSPARASTGVSKAAQVQKNIRTLQLALQAWCVDHGDLWPRYVSGQDFRAQLKPYLDGRWPVNPYTHKPMRRKSTAGNFSYATYSHQTVYRLIGWGRDRHRVIIVP